MFPAHGHFKCQTGKVIPDSMRCNHQYDCPPGDYSDEQNCRKFLAFSCLLQDLVTLSILLFLLLWYHFYRNNLTISHIVVSLSFFLHPCVNSSLSILLFENYLVIVFCVFGYDQSASFAFCLFPLVSYFLGFIFGQFGFLCFCNYCLIWYNILNSNLCTFYRTACGEDDFKCNNGHCIQKYKHCDRTHDCQDSSDELNCDYGLTFFQIMYSSFQFFSFN